MLGCGIIIIIILLIIIISLIIYLLSLFVLYLFKKRKKKIKIKYNNVEYINNPINIICMICLDNMDNDNQIIKLECNHFYHLNCINKWTLQNIKFCKKNSSCPLCKNIYCFIP